MIWFQRFGLENETLNSNHQMGDDNDHFLDYNKFLKGEKDREHEETDRLCLTDEHFNDCECQRRVLPLYFFLARMKETKMSVEVMKKQFKCGAKLIGDVRKAVAEKKVAEVKKPAVVKAAAPAAKTAAPAAKPAEKTQMKTTKTPVVKTAAKTTEKKK